MLLFWQLSEELTGYPSVDDKMIEEESTWIHSQLTGDGFLSLYGNEHVYRDIDQKDIVNVLSMLHVNKFEVRRILQVRFTICYAWLSDLVFVSY